MQGGIDMIVKKLDRGEYEVYRDGSRSPSGAVCEVRPGEWAYTPYDGNTAPAFGVCMCDALEQGGFWGGVAGEN